MKSIETITIKIKKIMFYVEDYCAVLSFASEDSADPSNYLILTRPSSEIDGGQPEEDYEWDLSVDYEGGINKLDSYVLSTAGVVDFIFNDGTLKVRLLFNDDGYPLNKWLDFIFAESAC